VHVIAGLTEAPDGTLLAEKKPAGHGVHARSEEAVAACERYVPAGHVEDCGRHETPTFTWIVEAVLFAEKVPAGHAAQMRSVVGVEEAAK